jgi:anti-sigma B factor antagonist
VPLLEVRVAEGEKGPVLVLSGESDLTTLGQLNSALEELIWTGARHLTVDLSRLRYADSASIAALAQAARTLREQGGQLELLHPQQSVARILSLTGVDQVVIIRAKDEAETSINKNA